MQLKHYLIILLLLVVLNVIFCDGTLMVISFFGVAIFTIAQVFIK